MNIRFQNRFCRIGSLQNSQFENFIFFAPERCQYVMDHVRSFLGGILDTNAQTGKFLSAAVLDDRFHAFMSACTPPFPDSGIAKRQINVIKNNQHPRIIKSEHFLQFLQRQSRFIHVGHGFGQYDLLVADHGFPILQDLSHPGQLDIMAPANLIDA